MVESQVDQVTPILWARNDERFVKFVRQYSLSVREFAGVLDEAAKVIFEGFDNFQFVSHGTISGLSKKLAGVICKVEQRQAYQHVLASLCFDLTSGAAVYAGCESGSPATAEMKLKRALFGARDLLAILIAAESFPPQANDPYSVKIAKAVGVLAVYWRRVIAASAAREAETSAEGNKTKIRLDRLVSESLKILGVDVDLRTCRGHINAIRVW